MTLRQAPLAPVVDAAALHCDLAGLQSAWALFSVPSGQAVLDAAATSTTLYS